MFADKLLMGVNMFPTGITPPTSYTTQTIVNLTGTASYYVGVITDTGWYRARIGAADGGGAGSPGYGGYASEIFYAYSGSKYLIWGCHGQNTGYPWPDNGPYSEVAGALGGGGATGDGRTWRYGGTYSAQHGGMINQTTVITYGGGGGGSPKGNGHVSTAGSGTGTIGGGGAGFICGMDFMGTTAASETEAFSDHTFSVDSVVAMVLAGGGGGQSPSGSGGGGGAWGDGGNAGGWSATMIGTSTVYDIRSIPGGTGPGGANGKGTNGSNGNVSSSGTTIAPGGNGGWAIRDYSTNTFSYGTGINGRPATEVCVLEKLIY